MYIFKKISKQQWILFKYNFLSGYTQRPEGFYLVIFRENIGFQYFKICLIVYWKKSQNTNESIRYCMGRINVLRDLSFL